MEFQAITVDNVDFREIDKKSGKFLEITRVGVGSDESLYRWTQQQK